MKTHLDWSAYEDAGMGDAYADIPKHGGDFGKAVAVCINSRLCEARDADKQLMCPSFRATGNPNLSTGGRVRMLKAALNSDDPDASFANPELAEAMDLCVSCKGCKRECENNVDMALIKAEFLAQRLYRQPLSARGRLFAELPAWLHKWPQLGGLARWRNASGLLAKLGERWLRIPGDRPAPAPETQAFNESDALAQWADLPVNPELPEVTLLTDTFSRYFEPQVAYAAVAVLRAAGYRLHLATPDDGVSDPERPLCCGRTYLSQGLVDKARAEAKRMVDSLHPHVQAGRIIVGMEASCVLGLRDDAKALGLGEALNEIADKTLLLEEFLARETMAKRLNLPLRAIPDQPKTLIHGHCHQKTVGAMKSMRRVLKMIPELDFEMIESSCCGMAGTFGMESEHAELSTQMAETALMPTLRENPQADVVANGFSCRHQMRAHGDNRARHLALLLRDALDAPADAR
ncbi:(Fe-S)-binding protein [Magnetofaba australis]|nr:(Fe-S)-binding protein [Magnetofaba australis]